MKNELSTKEKFIETACTLFQIKGYNATGLNEILKESGAPKGSLYYHFPKGKEQLALEAINLSGRRIAERMSSLLNNADDLKQAVKDNFIDMADVIDDSKKMHDMSISLIALETYQVSDVLREACMRIFDSLEEIYAQQLIKRGTSEKEAYEIAVTLSSIVEGAITISLAKKSGEPLRRASNQAVKLINC